MTNKESVIWQSKRPLIKCFLAATIAAGAFLIPSPSWSGNFPVQAESLSYYTVTANILNVRAGAGTHYKKIGRLKSGTQISVIQNMNNGWYKINYSGQTAYVSGAYIKPVNTSVNPTYFVNATSLNVRTGPGLQYERIGGLNNGVKVSAIKKENNGWVQIRYNGGTAYVSGQYLSTTMPDSTNSTTTSSVNLVTADRLNVRTGAGDQYKVIGSVMQESKLSIIEKESNGWLRIRYKGETGYVDGRYVHQGNTSSIKLNVPLIKQRPELPSGCEITSLSMALHYHGTNIDKMTLANNLPYDETGIIRNTNGSIKIWGDPDVGFVGDPKNTGYTINPQPLKKLLDQYRSGGVAMTGQNFSEVEAYVKQGKPVLVWFTIDHEMPNDRYWKTPSGKQIYAPTPLHNIVVTGYDTDYVYFNDPENTGGKDIKMEKGKFINIYNAMGKRALVVN